ncbi:MAG TPA: glycine betaine ABC transporter substrate-binding protein [Myxococcales bacterium]|nr:glycine betaine ABC transporter substrate-binding protein [Myxococcales bacterium]
MILLLLALTTVGSKQFTESVILGEIARQTLQEAGIDAAHRRELGGTRVLWDALLKGDIDLYPEYTGTLNLELLHGEKLEAKGLTMIRIGFQNTYAIGIKETTAAKLDLHKLSDLAKHPELKIGLSNEFLQRQDGWPRLREVYGLGNANVTGLQHDLAYRAIETNSLDATDLYSTDAEIQAYKLITLTDDKKAFPEYEAVFLFKPDEKLQAALKKLEGAIDEKSMIALNARARLEHVPEQQIAAGFLRDRFALKTNTAEESRARRILRRTYEHLFLVAVSLAAAIAVALPLGILAARRKRLGQLVLAVAGLLQTIPSLALLVFMIPLLGIGTWPAIAALFLYGLLPIVRATHAGLTSIPGELRESAEALGLTKSARLRLIELPMASKAILSGIQISAVISVGTATLGALVGAGGYGQPILTGIRLADTSIILEGAAPAALLALAVQGLFELLEKVFVSKGLRLSN